MVEKALIDNPFVDMDIRLAALKDLISNNIIGFGDKTKYFEVDLHLHTNYSDGYWTPSGLIYWAFRKGMKCIALTDHDGFAGIEEAFEAIKIVKSVTNREIMFFPGVEFSTNYFYGPDKKKKEIHVLGYFPSTSYVEFVKYLDRIDGRDQAYLEAFQRNRTLRIYEMVKKFNDELPFQVPTLERLKKVKDPIISDKIVTQGLRGSIAPGRLLTSTGIYEIYNLFMKKQRDKIDGGYSHNEFLELFAELCAPFSSAQDFMKAFFDNTKPSAKTGYIGLTENPEWAIRTILKMNGIPILAHPAKYPDLTEELLNLLVPLGLRGVEVISDHFKDNNSLYSTLKFVESRFPDLIITIGSDCHGHSLDFDVDYTPKNVMGLKTDFGLDVGVYQQRILKMFS